MTLITVTNQELRPDGSPKPNGRVIVGIVGVGWNGDGSLITDKSHELTGADGSVSFTLAPSPSGTWYVWNHSDGLSQSTFIVPSSGGPYTLQSLLVNAPSPSPDPAVTQSAVLGLLSDAVPGLVDTEVASQMSGYVPLATPQPAVAKALGIAVVTDPQFGAIPSTSISDTHDNTAAIQAAIDSLPVIDFSHSIFKPSLAGGTVHLPAGIYKVASLAIPPYVHLVGAGKNATTLWQLPNTNAPLLTSKYPAGNGNVAHELHVRNLTLYGASEDQTASNWVIDFFVPYDICSIVDVGIYRGKGGGIRCVGVDNMHIERCHVMYNITGDGILLDGCNNVSVRHNLINNNNNGVDLVYANNPAVVGGPGLTTDSAAKYRRTVFIEQNYFEANTISGVTLNGVENPTVRDNLFKMRNVRAWRAIYATGGTRNALIEGNRASMLPFDDTEPIYLDSTTRSNIVRANVMTQTGNTRYKPLRIRDDGMGNEVGSRTGRTGVYEMAREAVVNDALWITKSGNQNYLRDSHDLSQASWIATGSVVTRVSDTDRGASITTNQVVMTTGGSSAQVGRPQSGTTANTGDLWTALVRIRATVDNTPIRIRIGNAAGTDDSEEYRYLGTVYETIRFPHRFSTDGNEPRLKLLPEEAVTDALLATASAGAMTIKLNYPPRSGSTVALTGETVTTSGTPVGVDQAGTSTGPIAPFTVTLTAPLANNHSLNEVAVITPAPVTVKVVGAVLIPGDRVVPVRPSSGSTMKDYGISGIYTPYVAEAEAGFMTTSPNGTRYTFTADDSGNLAAAGAGATLAKGILADITSRQTADWSTLGAGSQTIVTGTIPASTAKVGTTIRCRVSGQSSTSATSANVRSLVILMKVGSVSFVSVSVTVPTTATVKSFDMVVEFKVRAIGSGGKIMAAGSYIQSSNTIAPLIGTEQTVNMTTDEALTISASFSGSPVAGDQGLVEIADIEVVKV